MDEFLKKKEKIITQPRFGGVYKMEKGRERERQRETERETETERERERERGGGGGGEGQTDRERQTNWLTDRWNVNYRLTD